MPRLIATASSIALFAFCAFPACAAGGAAPEDGVYLSWPGKQGAPEAATGAQTAQAPVALPKQFFAGAGGADLAAPPGPLAPHPVPGTPAVNNSSTVNTAANRTRGDMMTPVGDDVTVQ